MKASTGSRDDSVAKRVRVVHIIQNLNYGGMERLLAGIVSGVDGNRFESHVVALQYLGRFADGLASVAELHLVEPMPRYSLLWPSALIRLLRRIAPDVVHTHSGVWFKGSLAARLAGVPRVIHTEHGRPVSEPWHARLMDGAAARRTDVVVAVSSTVADRLCPGILRDPAKISVVLNGVDTDLLAPRDDTGALHRELGLDPATPILGSIGRLEWIKGYDLMIEAFARLRGAHPHSPAPALVIAGDGSERPALERRARELGLGASVHFLGWRDDVRELLSAFTLFTMSSRSEGTSVSLLEAMSMGICPVVTSVGGNPAVLGPRLAHRLATPLDPAALADAWAAALADPAARRLDAGRARARVRETFDLPSMVDAYQRLYLQTEPGR